MELKTTYKFNNQNFEDKQTLVLEVKAPSHHRPRKLNPSPRQRKRTTNPQKMHHSLTGRQDSPSQQPHYHGAPATHIMKTLAKFLLLFPVLAFSGEEDKPTPLPVAELDRTQPVDFAKEVFPFVKKNCIPCHNTSKDKAKLNMETPELMMKGSENGPVIIKGNGAESYLFIVSAHHDEPTMPPTKNKAGAVQLTPEELALLKRWIDEGAKGLAPHKLNGKCLAAPCN